MFHELGKRRNVGIRYDRYANALTASAVYNVNRRSSDDPMIAAFDFVRDEKSAIRKERIREAKRHISKVIGTMPFGTPRATFLEKRKLVISDLTVSGHADAEQLFDECWPSLKPNEEEN